MEYQEQLTRQSRLQDLLSAIKAIVKVSVTAEISRMVGVSVYTLLRIAKGHNASLSQANEKAFAKFLKISQKEFGEYLEGKVPLQEVIRNLEPGKVSEAESIEAYNEINLRLPKLTFYHLYELMRSCQAMFIAKADRQMSHAGIPKAADNASPESEFIKRWDLSKLAEASRIPIERLAEIRDGSLPDCSEASGLIRAGLDPEHLKNRKNPINKRS